MTENIKVCVRVRPFNTREKDRNAAMVISMDGPSTTITDPVDGKSKTFNFDQSYWSHDGFEEQEGGKLVATGERYAGQDKVFRDLGALVLENAYAGFNTSLFAYGQTGSGKSYSMVGYGVNKGIVPLAFESLFRHINTNTEAHIKYQVFFSMYEIYMEHVTDLLGDAKKSLKVRENPKKGRFFVDGLKRVAVASFEEIDAKMQSGVTKRTVAATQMNATSSRAHTIVTLEFVQNLREGDRQVTRQSEVNLIDLAGSERATSTGTVGTHLKEGAMINLSLSALGNVISALAEGKPARFRESVLTKLLQNSLGGNAKTIMIAALSPADLNYAETLSTLRYADRAKSIKTTAVVNESATEKLIRSLKEENERMKQLLVGKTMDIGSTKGLSDQEIAKLRRELEADIRAQLSKNQELEAGIDHDAYVKEIETLRAAFEKEKAAAALADSKRTTMHRIENLNEDPALCGVIFHVIEGAELVGRKSNKNPANPSIALGGLRFVRHCSCPLSLISALMCALFPPVSKMHMQCSGFNVEKWYCAAQMGAQWGTCASTASRWHPTAPRRCATLTASCSGQITCMCTAIRPQAWRCWPPCPLLSNGNLHRTKSPRARGLTWGRRTHGR
eukprot:m.780255 g.780255  ORF g.780255 m.780255 type:complete len:618 (-) comp23280_c2_seq22:1699-3552(-)